MRRFARIDWSPRGLIKDVRSGKVAGSIHVRSGQNKIQATSTYLEREREGWGNV
jgi:hypothetical protein